MQQRAVGGGRRRGASAAAQGARRRAARLARRCAAVAAVAVHPERRRRRRDAARRCARRRAARPSTMAWRGRRGRGCNGRAPAPVRLVLSSATDDADPGEAEPGRQIFGPVGHQQRRRASPGPQALRQRPAGIAVRRARPGRRKREASRDPTAAPARRRAARELVDHVGEGALGMRVDRGRRCERRAPRPRRADGRSRARSARPSCVHRRAARPRARCRRLRARVRRSRLCSSRRRRRRRTERESLNAQ